MSFLWDVAEAPALLSCTAGGVVRIHAAQPVCCAAEPRDSGDAGPSCEGALRASWEVSKDVLCTVRVAFWCISLWLNGF